MLATRSERTGLFGVVLALAVLVSCDAAEPLRPPAPNIVVLIGDDLGYRDLGFLGSQHVETPRLDQLAAEGTVFSHGYNTSSVCGPSLRSMLTGLHPIQWQRKVARLRKSGQIVPSGHEMAHMQTLPRLLSEHGYATFQAGKLWEAHYRIAGFGAGTVTRRLSLSARSVSVGRTTMQPVETFLDERDDRPFFLWFSPTLPHEPFDAPEAFRQQYASADLTPSARAYYANVTRFDHVVGQLLDELDRRGLRDDTLVVYLNDNGWDQAPDFTPSPWAGYKRDGPVGKGTLYDLGFRTPVVLRWPGRITAGATRSDLVSTVDLMPTLLEFAGVEAPEGRDGRSLVPTLADTSQPHRESIIGTMTSRDFIPAPRRRGGAPAFFVRTRDWHYLSDLHRREELYAIERDPFERRDLALANPGVLTDLQRRARSWHRAMRGEAPRQE